MDEFLKDLAVAVISSLVTVAAETAIQALKEKTSRKARQAREEVLKSKGHRERRCPATNDFTLGESR